MFFREHSLRIGLSMFTCCFLLSSKQDVRQFDVIFILLYEIILRVQTPIIICVVKIGGFTQLGYMITPQQLGAIFSFVVKQKQMLSFTHHLLSSRKYCIILHISSVFPFSCLTACNFYCYNKNDLPCHVLFETKTRKQNK